MTDENMKEMAETIGLVQATLANLIDGMNNMERRINTLAEDMDNLYSEDKDIGRVRSAVIELQEEVAKMANQPVGMMFVRRA
jgi:uncharacterized protein YoxC